MKPVVSYLWSHVSSLLIFILVALLLLSDDEICTHRIWTLKKHKFCEEDKAGALRNGHERTYVHISTSTSQASTNGKKSGARAPVCVLWSFNFLSVTLTFYISLLNTELDVWRKEEEEIVRIVLACHCSSWTYGSLKMSMRKEGFEFVPSYFQRLQTPTNVINLGVCTNSTWYCLVRLSDISLRDR